MKTDHCSGARRHNKKDNYVGGGSAAGCFFVQISRCLQGERLNPAKPNSQDTPLHTCPARLEEILLKKEGVGLFCCKILHISHLNSFLAWRNWEVLFVWWCCFLEICHFTVEEPGLQGKHYKKSHLSTAKRSQSTLLEDGGITPCWTRHSIFKHRLSAMWEYFILFLSLWLMVFIPFVF